MVNLHNINIFKIINVVRKREEAFALKETNEAPEKKEYVKSFSLEITPRLASLLTCSIAYTIRSMWFYRVEETDVYFYMNRKDFDKSYNDLRYLMLFLNEKANSKFENYESYKIK